MSESSRVFRAGTRGSRLALIQTREALDRIAALVNSAAPGSLAFRLEVFSSPGDRDRDRDLASSPEDFFSRDLDEAVREGRIDLAVHSAKDIPEEPGEGLDFVWLPWREDRRDVLICRRGEGPEKLPPGARVGVSSPRRIEYCRRFFPASVPLSIRGNVEERVGQLDRGDYDMIILAAAGLNRLGLGDRITRLIPESELRPPEAQGALALTFRLGDPALRELRKLFVTPVVFAGAGISRGDLTEDVRDALSRCEVCLHDALLDPGALRFLPPGAEVLPVGKRSGSHSLQQEEISALIRRHARRGKRVLRLKGGDPGIFGRLAEEVRAVEDLALPYRVLPGLSSFQAAAARWGILPTSRGLSRGFTVITPRGDGGEEAPIGRDARAEAPVFIYMGTERAEEIRRTLAAEGRPPEEPAAVLFGIGSPGAAPIRTSLAGIPEAVRSAREAAGDGAVPPGLIVVGAAAAGSWTNHGLLAGKRVLLTAGGAVRDKAEEAVRDAGGTPVPLPLIDLVREEDLSWARDLRSRDWIVLTSPAAAGFFLETLRELRVDLRGLPRIMTPGRETARALEDAGIYADLLPEKDFGADGMLKAAGERDDPGKDETRDGGAARGAGGLPEKGVLPEATGAPGSAPEDSGATPGHGHGDGDADRRLSRAFAGKRVLRLRSDRASLRVTLALRAAGAEVEDRVLYRNVALRPEKLPDFDAAFFASASAVQAFASVWGISALAGREILAIGKPTEAALLALGAPGVLVSPEAAARGAVAFLAARELGRRLGGTN